MSQFYEDALRPIFTDPSLSSPSSSHYLFRQLEEVLLMSKFPKIDQNFEYNLLSANVGSFEFFCEKEVFEMATLE